MEAHVYKQTYDGYEKVNVDPSEGYTTITCPECEGTGIFFITDTDYQPCVLCKTSGSIWVTLV